MWCMRSAWVVALSKASGTVAPVDQEQTRRGPRRPFSVIAQPSGAACNLDCSYCFFLSKEVLWEGRAQAMTAQTLRAWLVNCLDAQPDRPVTIGWQGGAPPLRGLDFFVEAGRLANELKRPGQQLQHAIQTMRRCWTTRGVSSWPGRSSWSG